MTDSQDDVEFETAMNKAVKDMGKFVKAQAADRKNQVLKRLQQEIDRLRPHANRILGIEWKAIRDEVYRLADDIFGSRDNAMRWLNSPIDALGGQIPMQLLETEEGAKQVKEILGRIEYGVYS